MSLWKFVSMIQSESLYLSRLDQLDDKYEGRLSLKDQVDCCNRIPSKEYIIARRLFNKDTNRNIDANDPIGRDELPLFLKLLDLTNRQKRDCVYANCWHINSSENYALWKIYTNNDDGIAIKTTVGNLRDCILHKDGFCIGKVKYYNYRTENANPNSISIFDLSLRKRKEFEYENELRLISWFMDKPIIKVDLNKLIDEIYISPFSPEPLKGVVESIRSNYVLIKKINKSDLNSPLIS